MNSLLADVHQPADKPGGLRARKRRAAMRHIQTVALDLFDKHGFEQVTVEAVAAAAEVSPSSVYRYFHTKEGLILHDEYDDQFYRTLLAQLQHHDLAEAALTAFHEMESTAQYHLVLDASPLRVKLMLEPGPVRNAMLALIDEAVNLLTETVVHTDGPARRPPFEARVVCSVMVWGVYAAAEQWYRDGAQEPILDVMLRGMAMVAPVLASTGTAPVARPKRG